MDIHRRRTRPAKFAMLGSLMLVLAACEERYSDVVVEACIADGQPLKFCQCTAKGMKDKLGYDSYAVFSDMIVVGEGAAPGTQEIVDIMEKHGLAPELLTVVLQSIESAASKVHALCRHQ
jgi:hypothetical protein